MDFIFYITSGNLPIHLHHHQSLQILRLYLDFQHDQLQMKPEFDEQHQSQTTELANDHHSSTKLKAYS